MSELHLEVVTPARAVLKQKVDEVILPGVYGQLGILPGHIPLVTSLEIGELIIKVNGKAKTFVIDGGFAEVRDDRVTLLTEACEGVDEIDIEHARQLLKDSEHELSLLEERAQKEPVEENLLEHHRKMIMRSRVRLLNGEKR